MPACATSCDKLVKKEKKKDFYFAMSSSGLEFGDAALRLLRLIKSVCVCARAHVCELVCVWVFNPCQEISTPVGRCSLLQA